MENQRDPKKETPSDQEGESRREFIKKLPYLAPVVQTFLLSETAFGSDRRGSEGGDDDDDDDDKDKDDKEKDDDDREGRRRRRQVSPHTRGRARGRG